DGKVVLKLSPPTPNELAPGQERSVAKKLTGKPNTYGKKMNPLPIQQYIPRNGNVKIRGMNRFQYPIQQYPYPQLPHQPIPFQYPYSHNIPPPPIIRPPPIQYPPIPFEKLYPMHGKKAV